MDAGAAIFFTDYSIGPAALGRALEERGFGSIWAPEHSHIPLSRASAFPQGGDLPKKYYDVMDPFVTLAAAAAVTTTLEIATGVCLVVQRDPIQTAKAVASLDQVSGGRFLFGIGAGWNAEEMADHGTEFKSRFKVMQERVEAMRAIWTKSKPEYTGEFVKFPPMMTWPKPVQKPHPPVRVGAARAPARLRRRARQAARVPRDGRRGRARSGLAADHRLRRGRGRRPHQALPRRGRGAAHLQPPFREGRQGAPRARSRCSAHAAGAILMATHKPAFKQIASGLRFPEGPVAMPDGSVILVEIERRSLSRVTPDGKIHVLATLGGGPNGAAMGPGGKIYVTNNGGLK